MTGHQTENRKVFKEDLSTHLRTRRVRIAVPLRLAVSGLLDNLTVEGLFRIGPGLLSLRRLTAAIDARREEQQTDREDPHLLAALLKAWLRELPDPLLCSSLAPRWYEADGLEKEEDRLEAVRDLLALMPHENRDNVGCITAQPAHTSPAGRLPDAVPQQGET